MVTHMPPHCLQSIAGALSLILFGIIPNSISSQITPDNIQKSTATVHVDSLRVLVADSDSFYTHSNIVDPSKAGNPQIIQDTDSLHQFILDNTFGGDDTVNFVLSNVLVGPRGPPGPRGLDGVGADNQGVDLLSIVNDSLKISLDNNDDITQVDLSTIQTPDDQTIDSIALVGTTLQISIEDDGEALKTINLASIDTDTDTDNQTIDSIALVGNTLQISLEDDSEALKTVDFSGLSTLQNGYETHTNLSGNTITLSQVPPGTYGADWFVLMNGVDMEKVTTVSYLWEFSISSNIISLLETPPNTDVYKIRYIKN